MIAQFILDLILSIISFFFCFYLPGNLIVKKLKLNLENLEFHVFSTSLGFVLFTFLSFIFDIFKVFYLIIPILILVNVYSIRNLNFKKFNFKIRVSKTMFLLLVFSLVFSLPMIVNFDSGTSIRLSVDAPWHFSLINELVANFPPNHPNMANVQMTPYHFFSDFLNAKVIQIFPISLPFSYFQYFSILTALLWVFGTYILVKRWTNNNLVSIFSVILSLFGGSFSFVPFLLGHTELSLNSAFGILQPDGSLLNPPFAMSLVILIFGLFCVLYYLQTKNKNILFVLPLFFGIAAMFKVYSGMILFFALFILIITRIIRKDFKIMVAAFLTFIVFYLTYWSFVGKSGFLFFAPLWAPHDVVNSNFPFLLYSDRMAKYIQYFDIGRIVFLETFVLVVYILGNLGTRFVGLILFPFSKQKKVFFSEFGLVIVSITLFSFFTPLLFMQSIKPFEIVQIFNYFLFLTAILSAIGFIGVLERIKNKNIAYLLVLIFLVFTLISTVNDYYKIFFVYADLVSTPRYEAYKFLKGIGTYNSTVLEVPSKELFSSKSATFRKLPEGLDIYLPALSNKSIYLTNGPIQFKEKDLNIRLEFLSQFSMFMGMDAKESDFLNRKESIEHKLEQNKIEYLYSYYKVNLSNFELIYDKDGIFIYERR